MSLLRRIEQGNNGSQEVRITPQSLRLDNLSIKAKSNRIEWRKAKESNDGQMTLYIVCGDARIVTAEIFNGSKIVSISSIASSGDLEPFSYLLQHPMVGQIVVVGHFDHEKINDTGEIAGCGGVDTTKKLEKRQVKIDNEDLDQYLEQRVAPDFFENVNNVVEKAANVSGKPVLGVLVDHLTYGAFPIIEQDVKGQYRLPYNYLKRFQAGQIKDLDEFLKIGSNIFPEIKIEDLSKVFRKIIEKNRKKASKRLKEDPQFIEKQRIQNPSTVVISTCPMPMALRFPGTFGRPNIAFVIRQPFIKSDTGEVSIDDIDLKSIAGQIYYPLSNAIQNNPAKGFVNTRQLLIETPDIELSAKIADKLLKIEFVKDWIIQRGGRIIIGEVKEELTTQIQDFP